MTFNEESKSGSVMGNSVIASPVPWSAMYAIRDAQKSGDDAKIVEAMADIVAKYVKLEDGSTIDTKIISGRALNRLFDFAMDDGEVKAADFTGQPSTGQQGEAKA